MDQRHRYAAAFGRWSALAGGGRGDRAQAFHELVRLVLLQVEQLLGDDRAAVVDADLGDHAGLGAGKNGWDVAAAVRQQSPGTRFVLVTGWGAAIDPEEARKRGVDEVIAKPYRIADLRQVADRIASGLDNE